MPVGPSGPPHAQLAVVGIAPERHEVAEGRPFAGPSGRILDTALRANGLSRSEVYVTNVHKEFLASGESLFSLPAEVLQADLDALHEELCSVNPNCVLVLGDEPMRLLTGLDGILKWRGSIVRCLDGRKAVVSIHPAWIINSGAFKWTAVFTHVDVRRAVEQSRFPEIRLPRRKAIIEPSLREVLDWLDEARQAPFVSFDYETWRNLTVACVGVGWQPDQAMSIPFVVGDKHYWGEAEECAVWRALAELLESDVPKIGQNLSFEWLVSRLHGIRPRRVFIDTMLLHHCLYPDFGGTEPTIVARRSPSRIGHSLAFINSQYTDTPYYKDDRKLWSRGELAPGALWRYNAMDVMVTLECALKMREEAERRGLWTFYQQFYNRLLPHLVEIELKGVDIDVDLRETALEESRRRLAALEARLAAAVGWPVNVFSAPQMRKLLYEVMGFPPRRHPSRGSVTADAETVKMFYDKTGDERLKLVLEIREVRDLISDVLSAPLGEDGKLRTHYKLGGTDGSRLASTRSILGSGTNLQNVPRDGVARKLFLPMARPRRLGATGHPPVVSSSPGEEKVWLFADGSQAEARVVAYWAPVPTLRAWFQAGEDVHSNVARMIAKVVQSEGLQLPSGLFTTKPWRDYGKGDPERQLAKSAVHGNNYGLGPEKFARLVGLPEAAARAIQDIYFSLFPEIKTVYQARIREALRATRTLRNPWGRERVFYGLLNDDLFRAGYAWMASSTVGDWLHSWFVELCDDGVDVRLQLHDGLGMVVAPHEAAAVARRIRELAERPIPCGDVPLVIPVDFKWGPTWGDLEELAV